jgi:hypothetical protein
MPRLARITLLIVIAVGVAMPASGARAATPKCGSATEYFSYSRTAVVEQVNVQVTGCGTATQVGSVQVEASLVRCVPNKCNGVDGLMLCKPTVRVCVARVTLRHPRLERASYTNGYDYSNSGTRSFGGSASTNRECFTVGSMARCTKAPA